jgi:hypothetical protein
MPEGNPSPGLCQVIQKERHPDPFLLIRNVKFQIRILKWNLCFLKDVFEEIKIYEKIYIIIGVRK